MMHDRHATALFHTFGCKLNFAETATIEQRLAAAGIARAAAGDNPDFIVINSCSVTEEADRKCRRTIRSMHRRYPGAVIAVTGCYAQLKSAEVASLPGVAIVAGSGRKAEIVDMIVRHRDTGEGGSDVTPTAQIDSFTPSCSRGDRTRFFLKVQDGCDYWCTYCTIPKARGRSRSGTIDALVEQAAGAAAQGGREIVITGVNIGDFGKGRSDTFFDLIRALDAVDGIERYRISSIEPNLLTDEIIDWVARDSRAFMPHFHVPLQSGSDAVLALMRRRYDTALFARKMRLIRGAMPHAFIGVDLITGARGETPGRFAESKAFVESLPVSRLHVFPYSERPGTRALALDAEAVPLHERHERARLMIEVSDAKWAAFAASFVGTVRPVLLEHSRVGRPMAGFTDNYLRVEVPDAPATLDNCIVAVRLTSCDSAAEVMQGELAI